MEALIVIIVLVLIGGPISSTTSSRGGTKVDNRNIVYNQPPSYPQQQPVIIYQQPPVQGGSQPTYQQNQNGANNSSIGSFAVKSYEKIVRDDQNGGGEHINSLILLMESEGISREEATLIIKRAIRKSNGNAEKFGNEIENSR